MARRESSLWRVRDEIRPGALLVPMLALARAPKPSDTHPPVKIRTLASPVDQSGMALYRVRCGDCHGLDASGYRGPI